jgi:hypothetical protein
LLLLLAVLGPPLRLLQALLQLPCRHDVQQDLPLLHCHHGV